MKTSTQAGILVITFEENLTSTTVGTLRTQIMEALRIASPRPQGLHADLATVTLVDSQGLNLLIGIYREAERHKIAFKVIRPGEEQRRLFTYLSLNARFGLA